MKRAKAKFKVGQIVCLKLSGFPIKIKTIDFRSRDQTEREYARYLGSGVYAWEWELRPVTKREIGESRA